MTTIVGYHVTVVQRVYSTVYMNNTHPSSPSAVNQPLDRTHVQLLLALRDTGRLALAADALTISASAASHRLREAERRVGTLLAEPDGRTLRLTPAGRHLADAGAISEATIRSAEDTARWIGAGHIPRVRLAADFYDTTPWFEHLVGAEDAVVSVVRVGYEEGPRAVERRTADIAIALRPSAPADAPPLAHDELAAVVPADHPAAERGELLVDDVVDAMYLTAGQTPRSGFEHHGFMAPAGAFPQRLVRVESVAMILQLVAAGRGISIQPRLALGPATRWGLAVVPLAGVAIPVRWEIVTRSGDDDPITLTIVERLRSHWASPTTGR